MNNLKVSNIKVSFCIPTYNGEKYLAAAIESILCQSEHSQIEIIINDDCSGDNTYQLAQEYASKYSCIKAYQNTKNLGMDGNFAKSTTWASGEYIWMSGQDDIFNIGAVKYFFEIIDQYPETNFIYFNYRFLRDDLKTEVNPPPLELAKDTFLQNVDQYFDIVEYPPSFLPAAVIRNDFWKKTDYTPFLGTHYVQVGIWLENFTKGNIYIVSNPDFIVCRMPENSWKETGGKMLFEIFLGTLKVYNCNIQSKNKSLPLAKYREYESNYLKSFWGRLIKFKMAGYRNSKKDYKNLFTIFLNKPHLLFLYITPVYILPLPLSKMLYRLAIFFRDKLALSKN